MLNLQVEEEREYFRQLNLDESNLKSSWNSQQNQLNLHSGLEKAENRAEKRDSAENLL